MIQKVAGLSGRDTLVDTFLYRVIQKVKFTFRCVCSLQADYILLKGYNLLMIGEQINVQRTNCFPGTCGSGEVIVDHEGMIERSLDRVNELSRVNESMSQTDRSRSCRTELG